MQRTPKALWVGALCWTALGCGPSGEKLVPVAGKVTVASQPLPIGIIGFHPDPSQGNDRGQSSLGQIQPDGSYQVQTAGKPGVPPGWYKVVVWATRDPAAGGNPWGPDGQLRKINWLTHAKYAAVDTTDLVVEVVERPPAGRYDFDLSP